MTPLRTRMVEDIKMTNLSPPESRRGAAALRRRQESQAPGPVHDRECGRPADRGILASGDESPHYQPAEARFRLEGLRVGA